MFATAPLTSRTFQCSPRLFGLCGGAGGGLSGSQEHFSQLRWRTTGSLMRSTRMSLEGGSFAPRLGQKTASLGTKLRGEVWRRGESNYLHVLKTRNLQIFLHAQNDTTAQTAFFLYMPCTRRIQKAQKKRIGRTYFTRENFPSSWQPRLQTSPKGIAFGTSYSDASRALTGRRARSTIARLAFLPS